MTSNCGAVVSISAWTLNSYINKFESLQEHLIRTQEEEARYARNAAGIYMDMWYRVLVFWDKES
jgi:hypothetical protein